MALVSILETVKLDSLQIGLAYLVLLYTAFTIGKVAQLLLENYYRRC